MKIKYGSIITNSRGKMGGQYYSRNHYGAFAANITRPINPSTGYQSNARSRFLSFTSNWKNLTEDQKRDWIAAAPDFPKTDVFGDEYFSTGKNLYVSLNINLKLIDSTQLITPPTPETIISIPPVVDFTAAADISSMEITLEDTYDDSTSSLAVYATPGISAGYFQPTSPYRFIGYYPTLGTDHFDIKSEYNTRFGTQPVGSKVFVKMQSIQLVSGQRGVEVITSAIFA